MEYMKCNYSGNEITSHCTTRGEINWSKLMFLPNSMRVGICICICIWLLSHYSRLFLLWFWNLKLDVLVFFDLEKWRNHHPFNRKKQKDLLNYPAFFFLFVRYYFSVSLYFYIWNFTQFNMLFWSFIYWTIYI